MYPDPAICKLVDTTDVSDGMKNTAEIVGPLAEKGLLTHPFSRAKGPTMPFLRLQGPVITKRLLSRSAPAYSS